MILEITLRDFRNHGACFFSHDGRGILMLFVVVYNERTLLGALPAELRKLFVTLGKITVAHEKLCVGCKYRINL